MILRTTTLSPLLLALCLLAPLGCKKQVTSTKLPDPVVAVAPAADPALVSLTSALAQELVAADSPSELRVRLRIDAAELARAKRPPINVVLVMDTSGSMEGRAIADARAAARALVDGLAEGDHFAVVTFDSRADVLVPATIIDPGNRDTIHQRIAEMTARGTTDLAAGLSAGLAEAQRGYLSDGVNRVVLLSDGVPNDDIHDRRPQPTSRRDARLRHRLRPRPRVRRDPARWPRPAHRRQIPLHRGQRQPSPRCFVTRSYASSSSPPATSPSPSNRAPESPSRE
jgi:hypothetical protein